MEFVQSLSELSIAFCGLAALVRVITRSQCENFESLWRIRNVLLLSLLTFSVSLVPQTASGLGLPGELVWKLSSALLVVAQLYQCWVSVRPVYREYRQQYLSRNYYLLVVYLVGVSTTVALQILNVISAPSASGMFAVGLVWFLILASIHFYVLVTRNAPLQIDSVEDSRRLSKQT